MVFVGTAGCVSGGIADRSSVRLLRDDARERFGVELAVFTDDLGDSMAAWGSSMGTGKRIVGRRALM